jgi:hypothetical protein
MPQMAKDLEKATLSFLSLDTDFSLSRVAEYSLKVDGNTLNDFTYSETWRAGNTESDHFSLTHTTFYSLQNLKILAPDDIIATGRTAPLASYVSTITDEAQQYYDGKLTEKRTFKSAVWGTNTEFRLGFYFTK